MKELTIQQAIDNGYKHCIYDSGEEGLVKIGSNIDFNRPEDYEIVEKTGVQFSVSAETIKDLVIDYIANQDEVNDEDGELCDLISESEIDFTDISDKINNVLSVKKYYPPAGIKLIP